MNSKQSKKKSNQYAEIDIAYRDYLDQCDWEDNYLKRELPKTSNRAKFIFDEFWNEWTIKNPSLISQKSIKRNLKDIVLYQLNERILVDSNLQDYVKAYEKSKRPSRGKLLIEMYIDSEVNEILSIPRMLVTAYESPEGLIGSLLKEIETLKPLAEHGKKFPGKDITDEHLEFYRAVVRKQAELEKTYGKSHSSSYMNAIRFVLKEFGKSVSRQNVEKENKAFNKFKRNHPELLFLK